MSSKNPFNSRESLVAEIEKAGHYIADHADSLLGDYPSGLNELSLSVDFRNDCCTVLKLDRSHIVMSKDEYTNLQEAWRQ